jgi:hypothetical protein
MEIVHSSQIASRLLDWNVQLARLVREAWTGSDGACYFPYRPLTDPSYWSEHVAREWADRRMHSWVGIENDRAVAHAALVARDGYWELGRLVSHEAPRGAVAAVCDERIKLVRDWGLPVVAECTQAHTRSQYHSKRVGLRFAGIGFLERIDGIYWDIVYYDNHPAPAFEPRRGVLADPLGREIRVESHHRERLAQILGILDTQSAVELPPTRFNVLPELLDPVRRIVELNL